MRPWPLAEAPSHVRFFTYAYAVVIGLGCAPVAMSGLFSKNTLGQLAGILGLLLVAALETGLVKLTRKIGTRGAGHAAYVLTGVLFLVVLPILGLFVDAAADTCEPKCDPSFRPLAMPEVFGLVPIHLVSAVAFFLSARRPEALSPRAEAMIATSLLGGIVLDSVLAVQFLKAVPLAMFLIPLPILMPYGAWILLVTSLVSRLRSRGHEALVARAEEAARAKVPQEVGYRKPAELDVAPKVVTRRPLDLGTTVRGVLGVPVLLGLHAVVNAIVFRSPTGGVDAFLRTCSYPLSHLGVPVPKDCHYLCTIAAQGSPKLVKPYRWGVRRGQAIVVNRQLALANAFEDLLHERWPRVGRVARRTYDTLAFPVSRALTRRWLANVIYVAMKPAELVFALVLLFCDPGDPEARIDRMYR